MASRHGRAQRVSLFIFVGISLVSCASGQMITTEDINTLDGDKGWEGIPYYLPTAIIPVSVAISDSSGGSKKDDEKPPASASSPATATKSTGGSATASATAAPELSVTVQTGTPTKNKEPAPIKLKFDAAIGSPMLVPDPDEMYFLHYTRDAWADDTLGLHADAHGLLQSAKGQSVDETASVGAALAELANAFFGINIQLTSSHITKPKVKAPICALSPATRSVSYEPGLESQGDDGAELPTSSKCGASCTWLVAHSPDDDQTVQLRIDSAVLPIKTKFAVTAGATGHPGGVLFRNRVAWGVRMSLIVSDSAELACGLHPMQHTMGFLIPNNGTRFYEDMSREPLVTKQVSLTVKDGMLLGVDEVRPSEALAIVKLPLTILQPIVSAPFSALTSGMSSSASTASPPSGTAAPAATTN